MGIMEAKTMGTLVSKLAKTIVSVGVFAADKRNTQQNYDYISADQVLSRAGRALAENGLVVVPSIINESIDKIDYVDQYNKAKTRYDATVRFAMIVTDGESQFEVPWSGIGSDYAVPDKALYKAITSGHKYFITKLLQIAIGNEDSEHEEAPVQKEQPVQKIPSRQYQQQYQQQRQQSKARPTPAPSTTDAETQALWDSAPEIDQDGPATEEKAHTFYFTQGLAVFGEDWNNGARAWLNQRYTTARTPKNIRTSGKDLTDAEKSAITEVLKAKGSVYQAEWATYKATLQAVNADAHQQMINQPEPEAISE